ncbi:hypothetical protein GCM10010407_08270 [Rarobacter incanus]
MSAPIAVGVWSLLGVGLIVALVFGLRRRSHDGGELVPVLPQAPSDLGDEFAGGIAATYVSTTAHGDWLARIGEHGLGHRAAARVGVTSAGVLIARQGEADVFIPASRVREHHAATGIAGKYAPHDGLDVISWQVPAGGAVVDTGLRIVSKQDRARLSAALDSLLATQSSTTKEIP